MQTSPTAGIPRSECLLPWGEGRHYEPLVILGVHRQLLTGSRPPEGTNPREPVVAGKSRPVQLAPARLHAQPLGGGRMATERHDLLGRVGLGLGHDLPDLVRRLDPHPHPPFKVRGDESRRHNKETIFHLNLLGQLNGLVKNGKVRKQQSFTVYIHYTRYI